MVELTETGKDISYVHIDNLISIHFDNAHEEYSDEFIFVLRIRF